jgi:exosortase O
MQTFIGYPLRLVTAQIVQSGLHWLGITTIGVDTILVFETGISKIDLPCSGIKSLWTGALFFFAATWIERRPVNTRWLLAAFHFTLLLLAANLVRVAVLVTVGQAAGMRLLAEMLHVPLGVLGFAGACAAAVWMLRWAGEFSSARSAKIPGSPATPKPAWFTPLLAASILALALLYTPRPETALAQSAQVWNFSEELHTEPWALSQEESNWLEISGVEQAERWRFTWQDLNGSMLFIRSTSWRAHHRPERCFEVYGLQVDEAATMLVRQAFPLRALSLGSSRQTDLYTAVYWLQSANLTTDDYASRIWADLAPQRETWVLVTILFDEAVELHTPQAGELFLTVQETVHNQLQEGSIP